MIAQYYINSSNTKTLNKNITPLGSSFTITQYDNTDDINPVFKVKNHTTANYIKVDDKYYYITNQTKSSQCNFLHCEIDPLMSNRVQITSCNITVTRNENTYDVTIPDSLLPLKSKRTIYGYSGKNAQTSETHDYIIGVI